MAQHASSGPTPSLWEQTDLLALVGLGAPVPQERQPAVQPEVPSAAQIETEAEPEPPFTGASEEAPQEAVAAPELLVPAPPPEPPSEPPVDDRLDSGPGDAAQPLAPAAAPKATPLMAPVVPPSVPRRLLILDTETTGLDPERHQCIEVGGILFDVPSRSVLAQLSFLLPCERNPAEAVNGIPAAVSRLDQPVEAALTLFEQLVASADAVVAHNAAFDRQWFGSGGLPAIHQPWICSMEDIRWPQERRLRATPSVRDLALSYGVPVWAAHRALTDCIYLAQVFERCSDLETLLQQAIEPRRLYRAVVAYSERQLAKEAGFRWNQPVPGAWSRRLSESEAGALGFAVIPVEHGGSGAGDDAA